MKPPPPTVERHARASRSLGCGSAAEEGVVGDGAFVGEVDMGGERGRGVEGGVGGGCRDGDGDWGGGLAGWFGCRVDEVIEGVLILEGGP